MDYQSAINNLHYILTNELKFQEINKCIFDAVDSDNSGSLDKDEIRHFMFQLLTMLYEDSDVDKSEIQKRNEQIFKILDQNKSGEVSQDELARFLREIFKEQLKDLQDHME